MRSPRSPVANARRCLSQSLPNQAYSTQAAASSAVVSAQVSYETAAVGSATMKRALKARNHINKEATSTRAATAAMRGKNRPMPQARETKAHTYARTSRAGRLFDTGCHIG